MHAPMCPVYRANIHGSIVDGRKQLETTSTGDLASKFWDIHATEHSAAMNTNAQALRPDREWYFRHPTLENRLVVSHMSAHDPATSPLGFCPPPQPKIKIHGPGRTYTHMFVRVVCNRQQLETAQCPSTREWISKLVSPRLGILLCRENG